MQVEFVET